nr:MAG TPA: portal [Caudoviricetes sp.]
MFWGLFSKTKPPAKVRANPVNAGAQFVVPTYSLSAADVDEVLKRANLTRTDLLKLLYDDEISGCVARRTAAVMGNAWHIEGDNTDWLYTAVSAVYEDAVRIMMQALWVGSSIGELIWQDGEQKTIRSVVPRVIEQFKTDNDGNLLWKSPNGGEVAVIPEKVLRGAVNVNETNPYGDALLSRVYWAWFAKNYAEQFWNKFAERHASPLTVIKSAVNTANRDEAQRDLAALAAAAASAVSDGTVALDDQDSIEFVEATNDGSAHEKYTRHQIQRIQKALLGRVLTSELETGSRAAQETDDGFTRDIADADLTFVERGLNHIVTCLLTVNGMDAEDVYFTYERSQAIDKDRWERDVALINTGTIEFTEQYYRDNYGLEPQHFRLVEKSAAPKLSLSLSRLTPGAQEVEDSIVAALKDAPEMLGVEAVLAVAREARDEADLMRRLALLYDDHDDSDYTDWLAASMALAAAQGYVHADKGRY